MLELGVYPDLARLRAASGVPKHIRRVCAGLHARADVRLSLLANADELEHARAALPDRWLRAEAAIYAARTRWMKASWSALGRPTYETLGGCGEWLYLPADGFVPTVRARLAATVHDLYRLDAPAPGERRGDHRRTALRLGLVYRQLARRADRVLAVSRFTADRLIERLGVPARRIRVVHNGVDPVFFERSRAAGGRAVAERFGLEAGRYLLHVGGLTPKKNARCLLDAWAASDLAGRGVRLVAVGAHRPELAARAERTGGVLLPGAVDDECLADLYAAAALVVLPSWYEGFGIPALEALAAGTPVVLADIPAFREIAGEHAEYLAPDDPQAWARAWRRALARDRAPDAARAGRRHADRYRWERCVERVLEAIGGCDDD